MSATISLIAAIGHNGELGAQNDLMWHLPDDFAWFINQTRGHAIVMGRKTMESLGKPLKNRRNMVVSRNRDLAVKGFEFYSNVDAALRAAHETEKEEIFVIGGGVIYKLTLPIAHRIYLTRVDGSFAHADTFFPELDNTWKRVFEEFHPVDEQHAYAFSFEIWERIV